MRVQRMGYSPFTFGDSKNKKPTIDDLAKRLDAQGQMIESIQKELNQLREESERRKPDGSLKYFSSSRCNDYNCAGPEYWY